MSASLLARSIASLFFILLAGCATDESVPVDQLYRQPPAGHVQTAWIKGSKIEETGLFASHHTCYVLMIDGKFVLNSQENCEQPVAITAGHHEISAEYRYSVFTARNVFSFEAQSGRTYMLKFSHGVEGADERRYCDMQVVDAANGEAITPVKHSYVSGGPSSNRSNFRPLD